jgi:ribosomal protein L3
MINEVDTYSFSRSPHLQQRDVVTLLHRHSIMDPVTVLKVAGAALSTAKGAWDVGSSLYLFFKHTQNFDRTAEAFESEVKALATACSVVGKRLESVVEDNGQNVSTKNSIEISDYLWIGVQDQIYACQKTVHELEEVVRVTSAGKSKGFFKRMRSQVSLNLQALDIADCRDRVRSHTASLHLILQSITM